MQHRNTTLTILALVLCCHAAHSAPWILRGHGLASDYAKTSTDSSISGTSFLELSGESGLQVAFELRGDRRFGWELSAGQLGIDATSGFSRLVPVSFDPLVLEEQVTRFDAGTIALRPLTAALLWHAPLGRLDVYIGPLAGVSFFDVGADMPDRDPELTYGGKVGADVRLGQGAWAVSVELRHLEVVHDAVERDLYRDIRLQSVGLGLSYGFPNRPKP